MPWHRCWVDLFNAPLLRPSSMSPFDRIADGVVQVLLEHGVEGVSMAAIGRAQRTSTQAFQQYVKGFRSPTEPSVVATLHRIATQVVTDRWLEWNADGLRLPETEEERDGVEAWFAFQELVRGRSRAGDLVPVEILHDARAQEIRNCQAGLSLGGEQVARRAAVAMVALADGLRAVLLRPDPPLSVLDARSLLEQHAAVAKSVASRPAA